MILDWLNQSSGEVSKTLLCVVMNVAQGQRTRVAETAAEIDKS